MYTLTVRDYLKCCHSLQGEVFGLAQLLHVITYEVDAEFTTPALDEHGIVVDFAAAQRGLHEIVASLNFQNLDEHAQLRGKNTTTEFLCSWIHGKLAATVGRRFRGKLTIVMRESAVAWTSYSADVP
jgi:6-pyruvoyl-tetrahydropterin synthase